MYSIKMRASHEDIHISGAETMCEFEDLENYLKKYFNKAFNHENGNIDFLNLKIEKVKAPIQTLVALPVVENLNDTLTQLAKQTGVSEYALNKGLEFIKMILLILEPLFYLHKPDNDLIALNNEVSG